MANFVRENWKKKNIGREECRLDIYLKVNIIVNFRVKSVQFFSFYTLHYRYSTGIIFPKVFYLSK